MEKRAGSLKKFGEILMAAGLITDEQLALAMSMQKGKKARLGEMLVDLGYITEVDIAKVLSVQLGIPYADFSTAVVEPEAVGLVPEALAEKHTVLPLSVDKKVVTMAMADPLNLEAIEDIRFATGRNVKPSVATSAEIKKAIKRYYHLSGPVQEILEKMSYGYIEIVHEKVDTSTDIKEAIKKGEAPPIIRMVNSIIYNAIKSRASDIHIEPREKTVTIRERIDGLLKDVFHLPKWVQGAVTSRIKIVAGMDISEKRIPQDGRIKIKIEERDVDLRISTLPIYYGESVVIRILDAQTAVLELKDLGLSEKDHARLRSIVERPQGIVLATGPTGSGKTSTLYAIINHINTETINIITLEDPIEYELKKVNQVAINEKTGLTFAYGMRSVLRQDPNVILVGEMRDGETATIAMQASITGHFVLSTLHTNTAVSALTRLRNFDVQPYMIASALNGVISQRLVRRLCNKCKQAYTPQEEDLIKIGLKGKELAGANFYKGTGCNVCNNTGYIGRMGIFEILVCTPQIRELIANNSTEDAILKASLDSGGRYMSEDGIEKVKQGMTSIEELLRVLYIKGEEEVFLCQNCGKAIRADFITCPYCGYFMANKCPDCGSGRQSEWMYCPYCRKEFA